MFTHEKPKFYRSADPEGAGGDDSEAAAKAAEEAKAAEDAAAKAAEEGSEKPEGDDGDDDFELEIEGASTSYFNSLASGGAAAPAEGGADKAQVDQLKSEIASLRAELEAEKAKNQNTNYSHPLVKAAIELSESGITDVSQLVEKVVNKVPDPTRTSDEEAYEYYVRNYIAVEAGYGQEQVDKIIDRYKRTDESDRITETIAAKRYMKERRQDEHKKLSEELKKTSASAVAGAVPDDVVQKTIANVKKHAADILAKGSLLEVGVTEADVKQIEALIRDGFLWWTPGKDTKALVEESFEAIFFMLKRKEILKAQVKKGSNYAKGQKVAGLRPVSSQPAGSGDGNKGARTQKGNASAINDFLKTEFIPEPVS